VIQILADALPILLLLVLTMATFAGFPISFTLGGASVIFAGVGILTGSFEAALLLSLPSRIFGAITNEVLVAIPLFLFMGHVLERAGLAEDLVVSLSALLGGRAGGLGVTTVIVGALLAGTTGVVASDVVALGLIALPTMLRSGYRDDFACGIVCSSATLAQIIPPATVLIIIADTLSTANQRAQVELGNFAPASVTISDVYAGALIPGLLLTALYIAYVCGRAWLKPTDAPPAAAIRRASLIDIARALLPTLALVGMVLGSLLAGGATATESASLGAVGALVLAVYRGKFSAGLIRHVMSTTARGTSMIFMIFIAASTFALVFRGLGGETMIENALRDLPGGLAMAMLVTMALIFVLGCFLDTFEIVFIVVPLFAPPLIKLGADPVWLAVMIGLNLQTSFIMPPHGYTLAYLRSVAPDSVPTKAIWRGVLPFVAIQLVALMLVGLMPWLATALPDRIYDATAPLPARPPFTTLPRTGEPLQPLDLIKPN